MADIFVIQDDIGRAIVTALRIRVFGEKGEPFVKNYTDNLEAYRLYLIGRDFWNKRGEADLIKSIEYFEKAIAIDPNYALAYAGLGDAYAILGNNGFWLPEKAFPKAKTAAQQALEIDDKLAEAHTSLAAILRDYDWDFIGAEKECKLAIDLNPAYATVHQTYANLLSDLGRHDEAIDEIMTALNLDPLSPRINANVGEFLCDARRYDQAYEELKKALEVDPNPAMTHFILGWVHEEKGYYEDAVQCYIRAIELCGGSKDYEAGLASCYARMGKREEAKKMLDKLVAYSQSNFVSPVDIASVFLGLGEKDQALAWLETAFWERDPFLLEIGLIDFRFDPIRSDPRFTSLLKRIGLK